MIPFLKLRRQRNQIAADPLAQTIVLGHDVFKLFPDLGRGAEFERELG